MNTLRRTVAFGGACVLLVGLAACGGSSDSDKSEAGGAPLASPKDCVSTIKAAVIPTPEESDAVPAVTAGTNVGEKPTVAAGEGEQADKFLRKTLVKGEGQEVHQNDTVTVNYLGQLWDGKVFDNSYDRGQTATFSLNGVVKGWKWGLNGTHVGDRVELVIPYDLGYGTDGYPPDIPGKSTLVFVVDVVGVEPGFNPPALSEAELAGMTELLSKSTPTDAKLPDGLKIYCNPGQEPQPAFVQGSKVPTEAVVAWPLEGQGEEIKAGDTVGYVGVAGAWGVSPSISTWTNGDGVSYAKAEDLEAVGRKVGARRVIVGPPNQQAPQGVVQIADIVSVTSGQ